MNGKQIAGESVVAMNTTSPAGREKGSSIERLQKLGTLLACGLLVGVVTASNPTFVSFTNVTNMLSQWSPAAIMAIGMTLVVLVGGFDLSIASIYSMCAVIATLIGQNHSVSMALIAAILAGAGVGVFNALLVVGMRINPYIATVGSGFVVTGASLVLTGNASIIVSNPDFGFIGAARWHGVPISGMVFIGLAVVAAFALKRTVFGHMIYAVGGNAQASRLSGLPVTAVMSSAYIMLGACCGMAGFISASQLNSAQPTVDPSILFDVLTIVILGGTSFGGGAGSVWQTIVGLVMVATISNGFVLLNVSPFYQSLLKGLIIIAALVFDAAIKNASGIRFGRLFRRASKRH